METEIIAAIITGIFSVSAAIIASRSSKKSTHEIPETYGRHSQTGHYTSTTSNQISKGGTKAWIFSYALITILFVGYLEGTGPRLLYDYYIESFLFPGIILLVVNLILFRKYRVKQFVVLLAIFISFFIIFAVNQYSYYRGALYTEDWLNLWILLSSCLFLATFFLSFIVRK